MSKRNFIVRAVWDESAQVFYSDSDIVGLHIEAATVEEFQLIMRENALELILENHIEPQELVKKKISDLIPTIFWELGSPANGIAAE